MEKKEKERVSWLDNPNIITSVIIGLILIIVILSQSFAIKSNLSTYEILTNVINHNSIYLLVLVYFIALKTKFGKKYFNYLNLFLIGLYLINSVTSFLTILQSFSLISLITFALNLSIFTYLFHIFFRKTGVWKEFKLEKSPFNDISNESYFYIIVVLSVILLAVNLIETTNINTVLLVLLEAIYYIMFSRYVYLYGIFLNKKHIKQFNTMKEQIKDITDNIVKDVKEVADNINDDLKDSKKTKTKKTSKSKGGK